MKIASDSQNSRMKRHVTWKSGGLEIPSAEPGAQEVLREDIRAWHPGRQPSVASSCFSFMVSGWRSSYTACDPG